ncbi:Uncharacterised protein [Klebsiella pneumoniae]|nr:hypothetical protein AZZ86_004719 [Klebsiella pneumoniae]SXL10084.1 Uncharacterised protein [Klebsiella pneumoniae]VGF99512.1 Uncharacterised protein [Klebsiella pneumoniae]
MRNHHRIVNRLTKPACMQFHFIYPGLINDSIMPVQILHRTTSLIGGKGTSTVLAFFCHLTERVALHYVEGLQPDSAGKISIKSRKSGGTGTGVTVTVSPGELQHGYPFK